MLKRDVGSYWAEYVSILIPASSNNTENPKANSFRHLLLHISSQMKRVVDTLEAMPRGLGVSIIRLDDALGDTWGLPLQACESWGVSPHSFLPLDFSSEALKTTSHSAACFGMSCLRASQASTES